MTHWSKEEDDYLRECAVGNLLSEAVALFQQRYDRNYNAIKLRWHRLGLKSDRSKRSKQIATDNEGTRFKKGHIAHNGYPIGYKLKRNGRWYIKVRNGSKDHNKNWEQLSRYIWKEHYGEIPEGAILRFKDGNQDNLSIDNLILCGSMRESRYMDRYIGMADELLEVGQVLSKLKCSRKEIVDEHTSNQH